MRNWLFRCFLFLSLVVQVYSHAEILEASWKSKSQGSVVKELRRYKTNHKIDGYEINCQRTLALIWGKSKKINPDSPQDSFISLIDLRERKVKSTNSVLGGVFFVQYLANQKMAYIESTLGLMIDLSSGQAEGIDQDVKPGQGNLTFEVCERFPGKSYSKYQK